jgi:hypothetical protein
VWLVFHVYPAHNLGISEAKILSINKGDKLKLEEGTMRLLMSLLGLTILDTHRKAVIVNRLNVASIPQGTKSQQKKWTAPLKRMDRKLSNGFQYHSRGRQDIKQLR